VGIPFGLFIESLREFSSNIFGIPLGMAYPLGDSALNTYSDAHNLFVEIVSSGKEGHAYPGLAD
jgi:hypothetical protein